MIFFRFLTMEILSSMAQTSENAVCSVVLLSLQGDACLPYLEKHKVIRDLLVRGKNVKHTLEYAQTLPMFTR